MMVSVVEAVAPSAAPFGLVKRDRDSLITLLFRIIQDRHCKGFDRIRQR